jgi:heme/copper-type cytochrome/quinol oxidase subunit 3
MVLSRPSTRLGWWSVGLAAAFVMLFVINAAVLLPAPGVLPWREALVGTALLLCGMGGGITALIALIRRHERSPLVWLALLPSLLVLFMIGEFVVPLFD